MNFKIFALLSLTHLLSCGEPQKESTRCRSAYEAQIKCQLDYAEKYRVYTIPDSIISQCISYYPGPGCYNDYKHEASLVRKDFYE